MDLHQIFNKVNKIEQKIDTERFGLLNIHIWPIIRVKLLTDLNRLNTSKKRKITFLEIIKKIYDTIIGLFHAKKIQFLDFKKNDKIKKSDIFFLTASSSRRIVIDEKWYDVFIDPLIDVLDKKSLKTITFEYPQNNVFKFPRYHKSRIIYPSIIWIHILAFIKSRIVKIDKNFEVCYNEYCEILKSEDLQQFILSKNKIYFKTLLVNFISTLFYKKLQKIQPKLIILEPYYGIIGRGLCVAGRKLGIITMDLQHGVQGNFHPAYSGYRNVPKSGFNVLPNYFLNWDENDFRRIKSWSSKLITHKPIVLGNVLLEKFLSDNNVSTYFDNIFENSFPFREKTLILITLQWTKFLPDIIKYLIINSPDNYFFLIRFHPTTSSREKKVVRKVLNTINKQNYESLISSNLPLYSLLRNVTVHITEYSSVVIEASYFDVKSIILNKQGLNYYSDYINDGSAYMAESVKDIFSIIENKIGHSCFRDLAGTKSNHEVHINKIINLIDSI
jgi:hypothetical protein